MHKIYFDIKVTEDEEILGDEGEALRGTLAIELWIDGQHFRKIFQHTDAVVIFDELVKSTQKSGKYLIFGCSCGIPECGAWNFVNVEKTEQTIRWQFERGEQYYFIFEKGNYVRAINDLKWKIAGYKNYYLLPDLYFYPGQ